MNTALKIIGMVSLAFIPVLLLGTAKQAVNEITEEVEATTEEIREVQEEKCATRMTIVLVGKSFFKGFLIIGKLLLDSVPWVGLSLWNAHMAFTAAGVFV